MLQFIKEETCSYDHFIDMVKHKVAQQMGEGYSVSIYKVTKNNSLELDSLVVLKEGKNFAPNIYLRSYYESHLEGVGIDEITDRLCCIYNNSLLPIVKDDFSYRFDEMKSCIIYRLVNYDKNEKLLCNIPHIKYLDLAITFHCLVRNDEEGIGTIRITNEHMELWDITVSELEEVSRYNTSKFFPANIRSIDEVLRQLMQDETYQINEEDISYFSEGADGYPNTDKVSMYILSNKKGINGASCLLYDEVITDFANSINSDLYILPSSIHEVIMIPAASEAYQASCIKENDISTESLCRMVEEVNRTQVAIEEVLSDRVYYYSRESDEIIMK